MQEGSTNDQIHKAVFSGGSLDKEGHKRSGAGPAHGPRLSDIRGFSQNISWVLHVAILMVLATVSEPEKQSQVSESVQGVGCNCLIQGCCKGLSQAGRPPW